MEYRNLGASGVRVSEVGLGTDQFGLRVDRATVKKIVAAALSEGINFFDTANTYGTTEDYGGELSEEYLGKALTGHREEVVIATKGGSPMGLGPNDRGCSRYHLMSALEASLRRLRTDHVDLYQIHYFDPGTPMEQLMRTLEDMVRSGKVRYIGASNFAAWQLCRCNDIAERFGWERFATVQIHYNLLERQAEREILPCCRALNVGFLPYYPLAGGLLTGRYQAGREPPADSRVAFVYWARDYFDQYATDANFAAIGTLNAFAQERGHTLLELALAWLLAQPGVSSVITGVSKVEHVTPDARAAAWHLNAEEQAEIQSCLQDTGIQ